MSNNVDKHRFKVFYYSTTVHDAYVRYVGRVANPIQSKQQQAILTDGATVKNT